MIKLSETELKYNTIPITEVETLYFDKDAIKDSGIKLRRLNYKGQRNYFTVDENNQLENLYTSVTTFTKSVLPTPYGLLEWMKNKTLEEQSNILKSSATYGTLMDILCNELIISGKVGDFESYVMRHSQIEQLYYINVDQWCESLKKDVLSFAQFVNEYEIKPILVSCPLKSDVLGLAGTLDLFCEMNNRLPTKTIKPVRINALIDYKAKIGDMSFKSERNSFYKSECLQLFIYGLLLVENFSDLLEIDSFFNFAPKNWQDNPTYNLKNWSDSKTLTNVSSNFNHYLSIYEKDNQDVERDIMIIEDEINLKDVASAYKTVSLTDSINQNLAKEIVK